MSLCVFFMKHIRFWPACIHIRAVPIGSCGACSCLLQSQQLRAFVPTVSAGSNSSCTCRLPKGYFR